MLTDMAFSNFVNLKLDHTLDTILYELVFIVFFSVILRYEVLPNVQLASGPFPFNIHYCMSCFD